jgi:hypothetical protein
VRSTREPTLNRNDKVRDHDFERLENNAFANFVTRGKFSTEGCFLPRIRVVRSISDVESSCAMQTKKFVGSLEANQRYINSFNNDDYFRIKYLLLV